MGYRSKVIRGAWDKTWRPLGWDRKKVAIILVGGITTVVSGIHLGWIAMIASATGIFWTVLPIALTAMLLFIWGVFETQGQLYADAIAKIAELEAAIAQAKEPAPNYEAFKHVERLSLRDAAFLWTDIRPRVSMPGPVQERFAMLRGAIQNGDLRFIPEPSDPLMGDFRIRMQRENPTIATVVTRTFLKEFARKFNYDPIFLRESDSQ